MLPDNVVGLTHVEIVIFPVMFSELLFGTSMQSFELSDTPRFSFPFTVDRSPVAVLQVVYPVPWLPWPDRSVTPAVVDAELSKFQ